MLKLKHYTVSVGRKRIITNINLSFDKGKVYAVMGPNGSGKTTFASSVMGNPNYRIDKKSQIIFKGKSIKTLNTEKRAQKGIFLSYQSPIPLPGISAYQLMRHALGGKKDVLETRKLIQKTARQLGIDKKLLSRPINVGFSGGESKKMEVLQAVILNPSLMLFDEIDSGVDIDSLSKIAALINSLKTKAKTTIIITHYNRILSLVKPDVVMVIKKGNIVAIGDSKLSEKIEKGGYSIF